VCTLTWIALERGYELHFNRDEKLTRAPGLPPQRFERGGRAWLAPTDPDGGGSWIGVNDAGVTLALLNGYRRVDEAPRAWRSRGLLVQELFDLERAEQLAPRLRALDLREYRSFTLLALDRDARGYAGLWDGAQLAFQVREAAGAPLCSSSLDPTGATKARQELFDVLRRERGGVDAELLREFHASHAPERGPLSPCMHRADAQTQSFTLTRVAGDVAELEYTPGAPCLGLAPTTLALSLRRAASAPH
jgi:hypothetical protein